MGMIILDNQTQKVIKNIFREVFTSKLEQNLHSIKIPFMSSWESFSKFSDFDNKVIPEVIICRTV